MLLVIQVSPQRQPVGTSDGVFLRRTIGGDGRPACLPMDGYAMQSLRQRGFEPLQQAQMVLQYVEKHGRITRREAAELCRLSPDQAYRLLTRLTAEGQLARRGSKKGAWYERHA